MLFCFVNVLQLGKDLPYNLQLSSAYGFTSTHLEIYFCWLEFLIEYKYVYL